MADLPPNDAPKTTRATMDRRGFLRGLLGASALVAVAPTAAAETWGEEGTEKPQAPMPESPPEAGVADAYPPPYFAQTISLNELVDKNSSVMIPDPANDTDTGSKAAPILITYDGSISPDRVEINNVTGILKVDGIHRVQWPVPRERTHADPKNLTRHWLRDEIGPHVHIAPLNGAGEPDMDKIIPASVPATRAHWMHSTHVYTHAEKIEPHLKTPEYGRYHRIQPPPSHNGKLQRIDQVDTTRLDYRQWAYENGAKTAYNILHWQPDQKTFRPERNNLLALNLAMLESSWLDTPGCNPYIENKYGYMGLFQFGIGALNAHKKMVSGSQWQGIEINGDTIKNNASFMNNWQAQMAAFQYHAYSLAQQMDKPWRQHRKEKHMRGVGLTGMIAAAHLTGPGGARKFAQTGKPVKDGTKTPNSMYAQRYGVLADDTFYHGYDISVTKEAQQVMDEMFVREHPERKPPPPQSISDEMLKKQEMKLDNLRTIERPSIKWQSQIKDARILEKLKPRIK